MIISSKQFHTVIILDGLGDYCTFLQQNLLNMSHNFHNYNFSVVCLSYGRLIATPCVSFKYMQL